MGKPYRWSPLLKEKWWGIFTNTAGFNFLEIPGHEIVITHLKPVHPFKMLPI